MKVIQFTLQKIITWTNFFGKGFREWHRACLDVGLSHRKLKTPLMTKFVSKVILFQKTLEYCDVINLCHGRQENQEFKFVCQMHTHGQFVKWSLKLCFLL